MNIIYEKEYYYNHMTGHCDKRTCELCEDLEKRLKDVIDESNLGEES